MRVLTTVLLFASDFFLAATLLDAEDLPPAPCPKIVTALQPLVGNHIPGPTVTRVATKDRVLRPNAVSWSDLVAERPMQMDNLFWLASISIRRSAANE